MIRHAPNKRPPGRWEDPAFRETTVPEDDKAPETKRMNGDAHGAVDKDLLISPELSDDSIALKFAAKHHEDLRYVDAWGKWLHWDGSRWRWDKVLGTFAQARKICRAESVKCDIPRDSKAVASARTVAAVERLARCDERLAAMSDQWDADPWLLKTQAASLICGPAIYGPPGAKTTAPGSPQLPQMASVRCGLCSSTASLPTTPISSPLCKGCAAMP